MKYKIVESVNKKENINHPVDDNFTLSEELLNIKSEKINESNNTETNDGLWKEIVNILNDENMKFDEGQFGKSGSVFIEFWTDTAGQDVSVGFETDGTPKDFIEKFYEYADNYDVDEELNLYKDYLGENGVPSSLDTLEEDMEEAKETLMTVADRLYEIIQREYRNESLEEDYEYSEYDKKLLVNRAKTLAKQISELYNSNQVEAQGELPSENEIAKALLESPQKIDMYAKFLSKMKGTKKAESLIEKLVKELMSFKKKLSMVKKPQPATESIERYSDVVPKENRKYWYFTTHGIGPGTLPKDVNLLKVVEGQNDKGTWGDYLLLDAVLNTDELKYYGLRELSPKYGMNNDDFNESMDEDMRSVYSMSDDQMSDWKQICRAFAKKVGAKLLFVNNESMGLEFPDGTMKHLYIEDLMDYLGGMNESVIPAYATGGYRNTREKNAHRDFFMPEPKDMSDEELKEYLEELIKEVESKRAELKNESLLVEKAVPEEDRYENDLIKSIINKRRNRANAKLTSSEQAVANKYGITTDRYNSGIKTRVGRRNIRYAPSGKGYDDVNYVDMARKGPDRDIKAYETGIYGNTTNNYSGLGGSREEKKRRNARNALVQSRNRLNRVMQNDYREVSDKARTKKYYKNVLDNVDNEFDKNRDYYLAKINELTKALADNDKHREEKRTYNKNVIDNITNDQKAIINKHRKNKQESFKRVPKRSINESKVSSSKKNRK